jgi:hypothetical protein
MMTTTQGWQPAVLQAIPLEHGFPVQSTCSCRDVPFTLAF